MTASVSSGDRGGGSSRGRASGPLETIDLSATELGIQVDVHDRQQLELRLSYDIAEQGEPQHFEVDGYFFVPRNVGLNEANYSREQFYGDVTALMRLDADPLTLEELTSRSSERSPLRVILDALERFQGGTEIPPSEPLAIHLKLFAYLFTVAVRRETTVVRERLDRLPYGPLGERERELFLTELEASLARISSSIASYRALRASFWPYERLCHRSYVDTLKAADEFMSLFVEERLAVLWSALEGDPRRFDGSAFVTKARASIVALAREEAMHRRRYGYVALTTSSEEDREYFTYRSSLLKKLVHQALYLNARHLKHVDSFIRNAVAAVGAALAATWALATQIPATVADLPIDAKLAFFGTAVIAYVMKDRIKAVTNEYLIKKVRKFDHTSSLYGASLQEIGLGILEAKLSERMRFVAFGDVPEHIRAIRLEHRTVRQLDLFANEEVIHYQKLLRLERTDDTRTLPDGYRMLDILRLNVRHFLVRLDDPSEKMRFFDYAHGGFFETKLPKVYHLNLVLEARHLEGGKTEILRRAHLRVVLNKNGIVRVERVQET